MSDTEQCIECIANCSLFLCEILCFCCFTDSNWCNACCTGCENRNQSSNVSSTYPSNACVTNQPTATPQHYPSSIVPQPTAPCEEASLLSPTKDDKIDDLPPSYEEATKGQLLESITMEYGTVTK